MGLRRPKKTQRKLLEDATENSESFTLTSAKSQTVWKSMKAQVKTMSPPLPELWRRKPTESIRSPLVAEPHWLQDEEESFFCESLIGLMQRLKRYDFLRAR